MRKMRNVDEIINTVNNIYNGRETTMLMLEDEKEGLIRVKAAAEKWYIVLNGTFRNVSHDLHFTGGCQFPFIMMYFQLNGTSTFADRSNISVTKRMHSLNYLPSFKL